MLLQLLSGNASILMFLMVAIGLITAITIHEFSHAFVADKLGDPTARLAGRLTLNPLAHLDPLGTLFILISGFGWGKPVPFDPYNLRDGRKDAALISLAGPVSNLILAAILALIFRFLSQTGPTLGSTIYLNTFMFGQIIRYIIVINVSLAIFNLLPISPLDGFKVVGGILPESLAREWYQLERLGFLILLFFVFLTPGFLNITVTPVMNFILKLLLGPGIF